MSRAAVEVPWHQKRLDLAIATPSGTVIAVELKVSKWRRAIEQAYLNRWVSSVSWVGIWHECITADTYRYAREAGVGLLAVTPGTIYPLVSGATSPRPDAVATLAAEINGRGLRLRDLLGQARPGGPLALA